MNISINIEHVPEEEQFRLYHFLRNKFETKSRDEILNMELTDFENRGDICRRTRNLLAWLGIRSLLDLTGWSKFDFPRGRGFGKATMKEIENLLNKYGFEFPD